MRLILKTSGGGTVLSRIPKETLAFITLHGDWERGRMVSHGGLYDQPARYLAAMKILDSTVAIIERENRKKERAKAGLTSG